MGDRGGEDICQLASSLSLGLCFIPYPTSHPFVKWKKTLESKKCEKIFHYFNGWVLNSKDDFPFRFV